jgi:hypothetical protein
MQTLERTEELGTAEQQPVRERRRRTLAVVTTVVVIAAVAAGVAYAFGSANSTTKTIVKTVQASAPSVAPPISVDDRGFSKLDNGHQAETNVFTQPVDPATRLLLQHQLELAREAAMQYPTVAAAEAAGWRRAGPFAPGLGAHYFNFSQIGDALIPNGTIDDAGALHPAALIYDGTHPDSRIAGLMYYSVSNRLPHGFAGPNDIWHYHTNVCTVYRPDGSVDAPFGADQTVSKAACDRVHGTLMRRTQWMLHAWVVPGYDSPEGVFSHDNPAITCRDGSYHTIPLEDIGSRSSVCVDGGE